MSYFFRGSVCSDLRSIKQFIDKILINLNDYIKDKDTMFDVRLILNELMVNGALHGNKSSEQKCVSLYLKMEDGKIHIEVKDEGPGIDYDIKSYNCDDLKPCGRGLVLVNGLSDEFYVEKNKVVSIKHLERR